MQPSFREACPPYLLSSLLSELDLDRAGLAAVRAAAATEGKAPAALHAYFCGARDFRHPVEEPAQPTAVQYQVAEDAVRNILIASPNYPPHDFGARIDWSFSAVPDREWLWQLHRMNSWLALAQVYRHSGDERYAQAWATQFLDWTEHNLVQGQPEYAWRTIEVGIRGNAWIGQFQLFRAAAAFTPAVCTAFLAACLEHARRLDAALTACSTGSNWRLMEAEGLAAIALRVPEFRAAAGWRDRAFAVLRDNLARQIRDDGMHFEQCFNYHQGCIGWFARTALLAQMNGQGESFGAAYFAGLEAMCAALMKMSFPDGTVAQFGDGHSTQSVRATLLEWAEPFRREDFRFVGSAGAAGRPPAEASYALPASGFYALRSGWDVDATMLILKCGPDGGWHCQPDNGSFELFAGGRRLTPDSGCYLYSGDADARAWFRRSAVHQTLTLAGADNAYAPRLRLWHSTADLDVLTVENAGSPEFTHRRTVLFAKPDLFLLVDEALGAAAGELRLHFQLAPAPDAAVIDPAGLSAATGFPDGVNLRIVGMPAPDLTLVEEEGQVSFNYGHREPRPAFAFVQLKPPSGAPLRMLTVLQPFAGAAAEPVLVRPMPGSLPGGARQEFALSVGLRRLRLGFDWQGGAGWRSENEP